MFKGISFTLVPNIKTSLWKATAPTTVVLQCCSSGVRIGDSRIDVNHGFKLVSQENNKFQMAAGDELFIIASDTCDVDILVQA